MSGLEIQIEAEQVNKMISDAILKSSIGKQVEEAVEKVVKDIRENSWNTKSWLDSSIRTFIQQELDKVIVEEYGDRLREAIKKNLEKNIDALISEATASIQVKQDRRY